MKDNVISAIRALTQNWLRTLLTMSGIVVGEFAIVTLIAILTGVKSEIGRQVQGLGANLVLIVPSKLDDNGQMNPAAMIGISSLTDSDIDTLRKVPGISRVSPVSIVSGEVDLGEGATAKSASALVVATDKNGVLMNPTPMAEGRYFEDNEDHVCLLAEKPRRELFGDGPAVGQTVRIQNNNWKVVGVLKKPEADGTLGSAMLGLSTLVYLPSHTVRREVPGVQINRIALQTDYRHPADQMITAMKNALLHTHNHREDFGVITQERGLALVIRILGMAQSLLVLIAAISLFVAGIGIMNIMLVTVTERTREIGVRKTVGARKSDIFLQFLTEAVIISIVGGAIGLVLSVVLCDLIAHYYPLNPEIHPQIIVMALLVCSTVGAIFGVAPAVRAASLNSIDALRHE